MTLDALRLNLSATYNDHKRDKKIPLPVGVTQIRNLAYGKYGKQNRLDVFYPAGAIGSLPTIVNIHGGGYVYGTKEVYRRYCMELARHGFAVVSFNYRLAPRWKFPTPLLDTNAVMEWVCKNADAYHLSPENLVIVGDSAGAQLASQYAAIATNPDYAALFGITVPAIHIRALGLNCGMYDMPAVCIDKPTGVAKDYMGKAVDLADPRLDVLSAIGENYPPAYITTSCNDFLHDAAEPMYQFLCSKGLTARWKCYGRPEQKEVGHVFHVNIIHPEAVLCNDESCSFFREYVK